MTHPHALPPSSARVQGEQGTPRWPLLGLFRRSAVALLLCGASLSASAQTNLRIGLAEDPDVLDPSLARTYVGRIVFA